METKRVACGPQIGKMSVLHGPRSGARSPLLTGVNCQRLIVCSSTAGYEGTGLGCVPRSWFIGDRRAIILRPGKHHQPQCDQPLVFELSSSTIHQPSPVYTLQECVGKCLTVICEPFQYSVLAAKHGLISLAGALHGLLMSIQQAILSLFEGCGTNASEAMDVQPEQRTEATTHATSSLPRHIMVQGQARHCAQASVTLFQQTYFYNELSSWGAARKFGMLALLLAVFVIPNCFRALWLEAERVREEQELLEANALSLRLQRKRFEAALLASTTMKAAAETVETGERSTPGSPQTKQAAHVIKPKAGSWLDDTSQEEWRRFMSGSKASHVHEVWDVSSRSDSSKTGAPQASKAELEEITRRVRNANKNADGTDKKAVTFDDLYGCGNEILEIRPKGSRRLQQPQNEAPRKSSDETPPINIGGMNAVIPAEETMAERVARRKARNARLLANDDEVEAMMGLKPHAPKKRNLESTSAPANNIIPLAQQRSARKDKADAQMANVALRRAPSPPPVYTHLPDNSDRNGAADIQGAHRQPSLYRDVLHNTASAESRDHQFVPRTAHQTTQIAAPKPIRAGSPILKDSCILPTPPSPVATTIHDDDDDGQAACVSSRQQPRSTPPPRLKHSNLSGEPLPLVNEASMPSVQHNSNGIVSERSDYYANDVERTTNKLSQLQSEQCSNGHHTPSRYLRSDGVQVLTATKAVLEQDHTSHHFQDTTTVAVHLPPASVMTQQQQQQTVMGSNEQLQDMAGQDKEMDELTEYLASHTNQQTDNASQVLQAYENELSLQHANSGREHSHAPEPGLVLPDSNEASSVQMLQRFMRRPSKGVSLANLAIVAVAGVGSGLLLLAQQL